MAGGCLRDVADVCIPKHTLAGARASMLAKAFLGRDKGTPWLASLPACASPAAGLLQWQQTGMAGRKHGLGQKAQGACEKMERHVGWPEPPDTAASTQSGRRHAWAS